MLATGLALGSHGSDFEPALDLANDVPPARQNSASPAPSAAARSSSADAAGVTMTSAPRASTTAKEGSDAHNGSATDASDIPFNYIQS